MLEVLNISFDYGDKAVLDDVSIIVRPGDVMALAGVNGAGKTTLLRVMAGLAYPSSGTVRADRSDIFKEPIRYRRVLGYLNETAPVEDDLNVRAYLKYRARLKGEQSRKIRHRVEEAISQCGLEGCAKEMISNLSFGLKKRVALADAILLRPRFLLLDDVFAGLDQAARKAVGRILQSVSTFASVVITGHELDDLATIATRFLVLKDGSLYEARGINAVKEALK